MSKSHFDILKSRLFNQDLISAIIRTGLDYLSVFEEHP